MFKFRVNEFKPTKILEYICYDKLFKTFILELRL